MGSSGERDFSVHDNEIPDSVKDVEYLEQLSDNKILKKHSVAWNSLITIDL
jgi:hypothetical protein